MSMAPFGTWWFITVLLSFFSVGNAKTFVSVACKTENVGQYGNRTILECLVHLRVKDANIMIVTWKKEGGDKPVLVYKDAVGLVKEPGYQFADESWNTSNMNVSLLITKTEITHTGTYTCTVITDRGFSSGSTNLRVTAKYNTPTIRKTGEDAMECHSDGGYPQGELRWIVNSTPWQQIIETDTKKSEGGLYNLSSKLTLTKDSPFSQFTCEVYNANGEKESEATFEIPKNEGRGSEQQQSAAKIVAPLVIIGSIIVGLLLALLFLRRRSRQARRHSTLPLMRDLQGYRCEHDAEQGADLKMVDKCEEKPCLRE